MQAATPPRRLSQPHQAGETLLPADHDQRRRRLRLVERIAGAPIALNDELGKLACANVQEYKTLGWRGFITRKRGRSNIHPDVGNIPHKARRYLDYLRTVGQPVFMSSAPWSKAEKQTAAERGAHPSASQYNDFLRSEMLQMCQKSQWTVLPFSVVVDEMELRLSPPGVVPQRERRPRTIIDYSWPGVNAQTLRLAPSEAMQFGKALPRLLTMIFFADPRHGPVYLNKADVSDGFYQVWVQILHVLRLGAIMPYGPGEDPLIAFPLGLPMGWTDSPPTFCAVTETAADLANAAYRRHETAPPHRLDAVADTVVPSLRLPSLPGRPRRRPGRHKAPLAAADVFVDDFINIAQGSTRRLANIRRVLYHNIDRVFRPPDESDPSNRNDPISVKKLMKGDGAWDTVKIILGWLIDTIAGTIELPLHRIERLETILHIEFPRTRTRASLTSWHKLLGELRSMVLALPGGLGMFSMLQDALVKRPSSNNRIHLTSTIHDQLDDFRYLLRELSSRPTRIAELIADKTEFIGAHDAAAPGMGGVWLPVDTEVSVDQVGTRTPTLAPCDQCRLPQLQQPILWRAQFPKHIQTELVSFSNPRGRITNSDLELAGSIAHNDVLAQLVDVTEATTASGTDNTPTLAWRHKGSTTTSKAAAYLLRCLALHQRHYRYLRRDFFIPGISNCMADDCSRLFHLSDSALLAYFTAKYPQPRPWKLCQLRPEMLSVLISSLQCKRVQPQETFLAPRPGIQFGTCGKAFVTPSTCKISSVPYRTQSLSCKYLPVGTVTAASPCVVNRYGLEQLKKPFVPWDARSSSWGPRILV
jgi:hypothetical protein